MSERRAPFESPRLVSPVRLADPLFRSPVVFNLIVLTCRKAQSSRRTISEKISRGNGKLSRRGKFSISIVLFFFFFTLMFASMMKNLFLPFRRRRLQIFLR